MDLNNKNKKAFTLVELLVVISIIALLLAIMMPSLQKAREQARRAVCSSQLHDLGTAIHWYGADYNGQLIQPFTAKFRLPPYSNDPATWHLEDKHLGSNIPGMSNRKFTTKLPFLLRIHTGNYMIDAGIEAKSWVCPSLRSQKAKLPYTIRNYIEEGAKGDFWLWPDNGTYPDGYFIGYANLMKLHDMSLTDPSPDVEESPRRLTDSSNKHLLADLNLMWQSAGGTMDAIWQQAHSVVAHRAGGGGPPAGGNRLFLDGHVEWINPNKMGFRDQPCNWSRDFRDWPKGKFDHAPAAVRDYYW